MSEADLAICHLEGALDPQNAGLSYYPLFNAPHEVADALAAAGYDACSTAGNHTLDHGFTGVSDTLDILDAAGIRHAGSARNEEERLPSLYEVNGVTVGHIAYTYGTNGIPAPADKPWAVNLIDDGDAILEDARWARRARRRVRDRQPPLGHRVPDPAHRRQAAPWPSASSASPDIDLILGAHVHVVQPIGRVNGEVVVYGMGNQLSNMRTYGGHTGTEDGVHGALHRAGDRRPLRGHQHPVHPHLGAPHHQGGHPGSPHPGLRAGRLRVRPGGLAAALGGPSHPAGRGRHHPEPHSLAGAALRRATSPPWSAPPVPMCSPGPPGPM